MDKIFIFLAKCFKKIASMLERLGQTKESHEDRVKMTSSRYDMAQHPDEPYYRQQYMHWIRQAIGNDHKDFLALDLGCGQGRLTIPVSEFCKHITGVDFTTAAIETAKEYSIEADRQNIDFIVSDILEFVKKQPKETFDCVVFTEVIFFLPSYKEVLKEICRILKPNGTAFIAFRPQYHDILHSIRHRQWDSAQMVINQREGYLWGGQAWFSWQTKDDIENILCKIGFNQISCVGIGVCSGIEGDPLDNIARPSLLDPEAQKQLMDIEIKLAEKYAQQGRYILAIVKK